MSTSGVHFMAVARAKEQLAELDVQYAGATSQLKEAVKLGDLRENSEYEIAKTLVQRLTREREALSSVAVMPVVRSNDNIKVIEEGSIVHVTIYAVVNEPIKAGSAEFEKLKQGNPVFDGVLMYGATMSYHDLLSDKALSADTPVGRFILGKRPGDYCVPVPGGFSCLVVEKLHSSTDVESLYCEV